MLRIKDNIDLKELEKYGFKFERGTTYIKEIDNITYIYVSECDLKYIDCVIDPLSSDSSICDLIDTLFDLIQAGLVEKVE